MAIPWCLTRHWPVTACWRSPRLYRVLAPDSEPTPFPVFAHYSHRCFDVSSKPLVEPPITSRPLWHLPGRKDRVRHQNPLGPGPRGVHHRAGVGLVRDTMDSGGARPPTPAWSPEERRVGKARVSTCRSRWSPHHYKHTTATTTSRLQSYTMDKR